MNVNIMFHFSKKIKKLDVINSQNNQIIATMRHEIDLLSSHRASYKAIETENADLKSKLELMQTVESVLTASQKDIDDVLRGDLSSKDLAVMVGTLRRELNCNESRKNAMRKQLQSIKNDLRAEQEEKKKLQERVGYYESKAHSLLNRLKKLKSKGNEESMEISDDNNDEAAQKKDTDTPEVVKKPRLALQNIDDQNTPSPLGRGEFQKRIQKITESDSPYFKVKASSLAFACSLKRPQLGQSKDTAPTSSYTKSSSSELGKISIFNKPRIGLSAYQKPENLVYNGFGGTSKVLQSDLKEAEKSNKDLDSFWVATSRPKLSLKKKISSSAFKN